MPWDESAANDLRRVCSGTGWRHIYHFGSPLLGRETVSWLCIVAAAPVAATDFFTHDGMNFEKFSGPCFAVCFSMLGRGYGNRKTVI